MVISKPGTQYRDESMSKCQACVCGLYGQVRCGCLSAEEQGVTCGGVSNTSLTEKFLIKKLVACHFTGLD